MIVHGSGVGEVSYNTSNIPKVNKTKVTIEVLDCNKTYLHLPPIYVSCMVPYTSITQKLAL